MPEAGAEAEAGEAVLGEQGDELALAGCARELDPGGQQELLAGEPRGRVIELGDVNPADLPPRPARARRELELQVLDELTNGEHGYGWSIRSHASERTLRRTDSISSNCSVSQIRGGASWTTGSPRSSARQIRPLR